ncbi:hypothetical protein L557_3243 [Bordetella pertussis STO1-CNMC-0004]|nr:hypothetical protein L557_3243 [Bordetella pertussis STO1-CNMC-0004]
MLSRLNPPVCFTKYASCEDSIGCMHGSSEPDLRNWKSGALYPSPDSTWTNTTY